LNLQAASSMIVKVNNFQAGNGCSLSHCTA